MAPSEADLLVLKTTLLRARSELAAIRFIRAAAEIVAKAGYDPTQPRVPRGNPDGGQWTRLGPGTPGFDAKPSQNDDRVRVAQNSGRTTPRVSTTIPVPTVRIFHSGRWQLATPQQADDIVLWSGMANGAMYRVRAIEPNWIPNIQTYVSASSVEVGINHYKLVYRLAVERQVQLGLIPAHSPPPLPSVPPSWTSRSPVPPPSPFSTYGSRPYPNEVQFVPLGFPTATAYRDFVQLGQRLLRDANVTDGAVVMRGSAVDNFGFRSSRFFDSGRRSDYDVAIVSPSLFQRAIDTGVANWGGRTPPIKFNSTTAHALGLRPALAGMNRATHRDVTVVIYRDADIVIRRGPYTILE